MSWQRLTGVAIACVFLGAGWAAGTEYVVDQKHPAAGDQNPGTADKPFKTISAAVAVVKPGDTVTIKAGTYREEVEVKTSGTADRRITIRAAAGERVVVSGAEPVTGWRKATREEARGNPNWEKILTAEIGFRTQALFQDDRQLPLSRWPKAAKTKFPAEGGDQTRVVDSARLTQPAGYWEGGLLTVRCAKTTNYDTGTIVRYDPDKHELTADKPRRSSVEAGKDEYYVKNLVSIISQPGEWAIDTRGEPYRIFVWPVEGGDPAGGRFEAARRGKRVVSWAEGVGYLTFEGLEICHGAGPGMGAWGQDDRRGQNVQIVRCVVHHNAREGISVGYQNDVTIRQCIVARNASNGIGVAYVKGCLVEECEIFGNAVDGLVFSWYSSDCRALRNYIHEQWELSHPDGFQTYCLVKGLLFQDNLVLNCGQGWQSENTEDAKVLNNMWVGTRGGTLNLSPRSSSYNQGKDRFGPCRNFELARNTQVFNAQNNMSLLATFHAHDNIMQGGYVDPNGGFRSDHNLYFGYRTASEGQRLLNSAQARKGCDARSQAGVVKFRNAPEAYYTLNEKALSQCTPAKLHLKMKAGDFAAGDLIELNWDGRQRKVTEVGDGHIVFEPPLKQVHPYGWDVVCNWRANANFALDLRLADGSPGKGMGTDGGDVGCNLDIQAYRRGDFNGDGKRDLPEAPAALQFPCHTYDE